MSHDRHTLKQLVGRRMRTILEDIWVTWFEEYPGPHTTEMMCVGIQDLIHRMAAEIEFKVLMPGVVREIVDEFLRENGQ